MAAGVFKVPAEVLETSEKLLQEYLELLKGDPGWAHLALKSIQKVQKHINVLNDEYLKPKE